VALGGPAFAGAAGLLAWLTIARVILLAGPPASAALVALGRPALSVAANVISAAATLPLLFLLLRRLGVAGAGWHALVQAIFAAGLLLFFVRRESFRRERATSAR
jgi:O-antigen/teichoic acid export membrane protein